MSERKQPNIRFKGFEDAWEQRKLGELFKKNNQRNIHGSFNFSKTISISHMIFNGKGNGAKKSSLTSYKVLKVGDIAFEGHKNKQFMFGRFVLNDIGDGIMSPRFSAIRPKSKINLSFWKYYIHYEPIFRYILVKSTKAGTMMNELVFTDFFNQNILTPLSTEQKKIGKLLSNIDSLIAANQSKLEQLKRLKKLLMQKIFSQDWRFRGFNAPWEQRKLGELFGERKEHPKGQKFKMLSVTINSGIVNADSLDRKDNSSSNKSNYKVVHANDIAYNSMRMWQGASGVSDELGIVSPAYTVLKPQVSLDISFWGYLFKLPKILQAFQKNSQGLTSDTWNLKYKQIKSIKVIMPSKNEQEVISQLLQSLDLTITANQRHLDQLKELKKYLMQNMFV